MSFRITVLAACVMMSAVLHADQTPPNVLVIVADDMGWGDIGYHSSHVYTPNLDRLAAQGAKLNQHYVMPQCTPTRLALFTGRYPGRFGTTGLQAANEPLIPHGTMTLATLLRDHGYETALTGKWHMGSSPQHGPNHHGFEYSYGALAGAVGAYVHTYRAAQIENPYSITWHRNHKIIPGYENGKHVTDLVTDEAIEFIERDREKPFFLYLPYFAPHTPLDERGKFVKLPTQLDPDRPGRWLNEDKIEWFNDPEGIIQKETDAERRLFLAVVHHLDHAIGRVIDALDESGQRDNTIILFTSDNGPQVNWGGGSYPSDLRLTDFNQPIPFRGSKTQVYEGGMRVPGFVHWQGTIPTAEIDSVHHVIDWIPTIAKLTGCDAEVPEGQPELDGVDFSSELLGDVSKVAEPRDIYGLHRPNTDKWSLRHGQWKIVHYGRKPQSIEQWQLFNLESDPAEKTDIAKENAGQLERLHERFLAQRAKDLVRANHPFVVGEIDPEQSDWFKKYKKQENVPKANEQLLNQRPEPNLTEGFRELFDGKTLSGWTPRGGDCEFIAEDDCIVGTCVPGSPSTYLCTYEDDFKDFVFTCEFYWEVDMNTGVMFRARVRSDKKGSEVVYGPQGEMEGFRTGRGWSGGIYGQSCGGYFYPLWLKQHSEVRAALKPDQWNRLTIQTEGDHVRSWVNGIPAAYWIDDGAYPEGFFGLQVHKGSQGKVRFRNIRVRESE